MNKATRAFIRANAKELRHLPPASETWTYGEISSNDPDDGLTWAMFQRLQDRNLLERERRHGGSKPALWRVRSGVFTVLEESNRTVTHAYTDTRQGAKP